MHRQERGWYRKGWRDQEESWSPHPEDLVDEPSAYRVGKLVSMYDLCRGHTEFPKRGLARRTVELLHPAAGFADFEEEGYPQVGARLLKDFFQHLERDWATVLDRDLHPHFLRGVLNDRASMYREVCEESGSEILRYAMPVKETVFSTGLLEYIEQEIDIEGRTQTRPGRKLYSGDEALEMFNYAYRDSTGGIKPEVVTAVRELDPDPGSTAHRNDELLEECRETAERFVRQIFE